MKKLSTGGQKWLKSFHVFFAGIWLGGAMSLVVKQFLITPTNGGELYGIITTLKFIDDFIIIPGAFGSIVTALIYSMWTNWGWFKQRWIIVKWCINIFGIVFGTFFLGPWLNRLPLISIGKGLDALSDPVFLHNMKMLHIWGTFQGMTIVFAFFVSVLKPWKRKRAMQFHQ
jgi:hypothetical protein